MSQQTQELIPSTFTRFPDLPRELQVMIWRYAIPEPQVIKMGVHDDNMDGTTTLPLRFSTGIYPSGLLGACKVSRSVILRVYKVCIETEGFPRKIRLDGEVDTVILHDYTHAVNPPRSNKLLPGFIPSYQCFYGVKTISFNNWSAFWYWPSIQVLQNTFPTVKKLIALEGMREMDKLVFLSNEPVRLLTCEEFYAPHMRSAWAFSYRQHDKWNGTMKMTKDDLANIGRGGSYTPEVISGIEALDIKLMVLVPLDESVNERVFNEVQYFPGTSRWLLTDLWLRKVLGISTTEYRKKLDLHEEWHSEARVVVEPVSDWHHLWMQYLDETGNMDEAKKYDIDDLRV